MRTEQITIEGLALGQSLLTQFRGVRNLAKDAQYNKVQFEIAEKVISTERNTPANPLLQMFNKTDERFQGGNTDRARRAWLTAEPQMIIALFGSQLKLTQEEQDRIMNIKLDEIIPIGHLNPTVEGRILRVQVIETVEPDEYEKENLAHRAKQNGRGLYCVTKDKRQLIFSHTQIVDFEPKHVFLPFDLVKFEDAFTGNTAAKQMSVTGKSVTPEGVNIINQSVPVSNPELEARARELMGAGVPQGSAAAQRNATEQHLASGGSSEDLNSPQQAGPREASQQSGGRARMEGQGGYDLPNNPAGHEGGTSEGGQRETFE